MVQYFSDILTQFGEWLKTVLPTSPFQGFLASLSDKFDGTALRFLNWFIPFRDIRLIFTAWLAVVVLFYLYSIILRWVKAL